MLTPGRKWRGLTEWTRTDTKVNRLFSQFATAEAILYLQGLFSPDEERSQGGVQTVDEGQAAHELQSSDEERSAGEPQGEVQSVDELQAAHELLYSHWSEWPLPYSPLLYFH
jgi:hypothetical protein